MWLMADVEPREMIAGYGTSGHAACLALPALAFGTGRAGSALQGAGTVAAVARSVRRPERGVAPPFGSRHDMIGREPVQGIR
jgi:hypothetical protein